MQISSLPKGKNYSPLPNTMVDTALIFLRQIVKSTQFMGYELSSKTTMYSCLAILAMMHRRHTGAFLLFAYYD